MPLQVASGKIIFISCHFFLSSFSCHNSSGWSWEDQIHAMPFPMSHTFHAMRHQVSPRKIKFMPCHFLCLKLIMPCHFRLVVGRSNIHAMPFLMFQTPHAMPLQVDPGELKFIPCHFQDQKLQMPCNFKLDRGRSNSCHAIFQVSNFSCHATSGWS